MPYLTTRGGRIIGHEALIMQGLGLEELELNMMSQANLQDLAGNAMTSTVVGAAITAALSVFYNKFEVDHKELLWSSLAKILSPRMSNFLIVMTIHSRQPEPLKKLA